MAATAEKNISAFGSLATPSSLAAALVHDPGQVLPENQTRRVLLSLIGSPRVFVVSGDPNGVQSADGPALGITEDGKLWARPVATAGNDGWFLLLG